MKPNSAPFRVRFCLTARTERGTASLPYNTLAEAVATADRGDHIAVESGSSGETLTISKNVIVHAR
ncbi:MAG: hypothetical protein ABIJ00_12255 [Candidatus Eisenbacteria bacterium]